MAAPYRPPSWAGPPPPPPIGTTTNWSIEEIKGGTLIATHPLHTRACTTFGRAADVVDVPTSHESCSRLHARIAFDPTSGGRVTTAWLRDLGSTHGTRVNGRKIPPIACGRNEDGKGDGSRGVVVYPGDVIRFGESTREFRLVGPRPEEYRSAPVGRSSRPAEPRKEEEEGQGDGDNRGGGISWGIDMDDHPDEEDQKDPASSSSLPPLTSDSVPEKHRKTYERMRAKEYKLANLQRESERIEGKGHGSELTDGQTTQLERNRGRIATLTEEISALEDEIRRAMGDDAARRSGLGGEAGGRIGRRKRGADHDEEEEDDFFDRTKRSRETEEGRGRRGGGGAETEESLRRRWKSLVSSLRGSDAEAGAAASRVRRLKDRLASADDDDAYFVKNDLDLAEEASRKVTDKRSEAERELADVEKMLRVASNHGLVFDREKGRVMTLRQQQQMQQQAIASEAMPPPRSPSSASTSMRAASATNSDISTGKRADPAGPNAPAPPPSHAPAVRRVAPSPSATEGGDGGRTVADTATMPPPPPVRPATAPTAGAGKGRVLGPSAMMPPPAAPVTVAKGVVERAAATSTAEATTTTTTAPPPRRGRQVGPAARPPGSTASFLSASGRNGGERGGVLSDGLPPGRNRVGEGGGGGSADWKTAATDGRHVVPGTSSSASARSTDVGKKDEWRAPKDQDGSGITKLNAKFAGRY